MEYFSAMTGSNSSDGAIVTSGSKMLRNTLYESPRIVRCGSSESESFCRTATILPPLPSTTAPLVAVGGKVTVVAVDAAPLEPLVGLALPAVGLAAPELPVVGLAAPVVPVVGEAAALVAAGLVAVALSLPPPQAARSGASVVALAATTPARSSPRRLRPERSTPPNRRSRAPSCPDVSNGTPSPWMSRCPRERDR